MGREYRLGVRVVVATILLATALSFALLRATPRTIRAGQDLGAGAFPLGSFSLTERSGRTITEADLADRVCVASFIFTRCPLSCPRISGIMKDLQEKLSKTKVQLVSISVDPAFDTPDVLKLYAEKFGADAGRWWFLTGARDAVLDLVEKRFKLSVSIPSPEERQAGAEAVLHSDRLALVDRGRVVGLYDSNDPEAIRDLIEEAGRLSRPAWLSALPSINATLNGLCAVLLVFGWLRIRNGRQTSAIAVAADPMAGKPARDHRALMLAAVATSAIFLACYLVYHFFAGSVAFRGTGPIRLAYFTILISHTLLATFGVVPLVTLSLLRAFRGEYVRHASIAKVTFPIWLYVSITGVVIYLMLYQMPIPAASMPAAG